MNLRYTFTFFVVFYVAQFVSIRSNSLPGPNRLPFTGLNPIPKYTPGPINIETKNATPVFTFPFIFIGSLSAKMLLKNTGKSVELLLDQPFPAAVATGGIFYTDIYVVYKFVFFWYDNATTNQVDYSSSTINGKHGTHLEATAYYYNAKYGSFENGLKYRDGIAQSLSRVKLGTIPNPLYFPFQYRMQKIKKPGNSTPITFLPAFIWYNLFPPNIVYHAYPSSYTDENTGKQYYSSTAVVFDSFPLNFISHQQFRDTFGQLLDSSGNPLTNVAQQYPADSRPVVTSENLIFIITP